ncbi:MAG: hypothetical protein BWY82_02564 [Verrucomicrobia bacterium ADurb.Bin474]|nr:MAG: hypothetical protein BWY82_02564 [Verrucomicrobia bacterium ADurb.Bin474]
MNRVFDRGEQLLPDPWFCNEAEDLTLVDRINHHFKRQHSGYQDATRSRLDALGLRKKLKARHSRHMMIRNDNSKLLPLKDFQGIERTGCSYNPVPFRYQRLSNGEQDDFFIINDENGSRSVRHGNSL